MFSDVTSIDLHARRAKACLADDLREYFKPSSEYLFHYTTVDGLNGIMSSGKFWATDARYLNDASELRYGLELVDEMLRQAENVDQATMSALLTSVHQSVDEAGVYVTCFCEEGDSVNQWREYGGAGKGYSLGVDATTLNDPHRHFEDGWPMFRRVIYDRADQERIIKRGLDIFIPMIQQVGQPSGSSTGKWVNKYLLPVVKPLAFHLIQSIFCFKHGGFSGEREWRVVQCIPYSAKGVEAGVQFRTGLGLPTPYVELSITEDDPSKAGLPLRRIIYGSSLPHDLAERSLKLFLQQNNYTDVEISRSNVPFRN